MPPAPKAHDLKKQIRHLAEALPEGRSLSQIILKAANHQAARRMLAEGAPPIDERQLHKSLAEMARLWQQLEDWSQPTTSKAPEVTESSPSSDDPAILRHHSKVKVHCDGASKGNPGPASIGVVITDLEGHTLLEEARYIGHETNNVAEYTALITALEIIQAQASPEVYVFADSDLMVRQMRMEWRVKKRELQELFNRAQKLARSFPRFQITHVRREQNQRADALANIAYKQARDAAQL